MFYEFKGYRPVVAESAFVHPQAVVTGNVIIGEDVYIGPGAALRGDWGRIEIRDGCNVQENCTIHMFPGVTVILEEGAHVGHGAVIHGAHLRKNCLIGMNSVIMDRCQIGAGSIIGALTFLKEGTIIPDRKLVVGNPGRIIKDVSDEMLQWKTKGTELYQKLPGELQAALKPCTPLSKEEPGRPFQNPDYETWGSSS